MTTLVFSPNWLGDAVMALPAVADLRRHTGTGRLIVASRSSVAGLWPLVAGVDEVVTIPAPRGARRWAAIRASVDAVRHVRADLAVLLPNSFQTALIARLAGIPARLGYRRNLRQWLLTQAVRRPRGPVHQADYYRRLISAAGVENGPREPRLDVPEDSLAAARSLLAEHGWTPGKALLGLAPGAAYGGAKRWQPDRFAAVAEGLRQSRGTTAVLIGSAADRPAACAIEAELGKINGAGGGSAAINLVGLTDLRQLAGVLAHCAAFVSNDSGAMHLAAAVGTPVAAVFGPTDERGTAPLGGRVRVLTADAWCRPCMLRECPLDHRCMTGIGASDVIRAVEDMV
jgi:heptosyltransferase-2